MNASSRIDEDGTLLFLHCHPSSNETTFVTDERFLLQAGQLVFSEGYAVRKHRHAQIPRDIPYTAEILLVLSGELQYQVWQYDHPDRMIARGVAGAGELLIFGRVAHSFLALSSVRILEVKQGPYLGRADKQMLDSSLEEGTTR